MPSEETPMAHPVNRTRRRLFAAGASAGGLAALPVRAQGDFPRGPVRVIVALPPGGAADTSARSMAGVLEKSLKQPVIVENRPGGQFQIAMQALAAAPADGHTLLHVYNSFATVHAVQKLFDLEKQVTPLSTFGITPIVFLVRGDSPHRSLTDVIGWARANPGRLTYMTLGPGSVEHLKMAQIEQAAGFSGVAVPYRGGPDALKGLIGGEIDFMLSPGIFAKQFAPTGQVRVLATLGAARWSDFPDVRTTAEVGLSVPPMHYWGGYVVRTGTPPELVRRWHRELATAAFDRVITDRLAITGGIPAASASPEEFRGLLAAEIAWMGEAAKSLGLVKG
jgi:tripartite-type tricarboxylate transporter receptor subunit TctC